MGVDAEDLAADVITDPRWKWSVGMRIFGASRPIRVCSYDESTIEVDRVREMLGLLDDFFVSIDLEDPSTAGVLLARLPVGVTISNPQEGQWVMELEGHTYGGSTLAEAALRAVTERL